MLSEFITILAPLDKLNRLLPLEIDESGNLLYLSIHDLFLSLYNL